MRDSKIDNKEKKKDKDNQNGINGSNETEWVTYEKACFTITIDICDYPNRRIDLSIIDELYRSNSSHGIAGSQNLGNTCFMNSSIQCLSNTIDLTAYFLSKEYKKDINKNNTLGLGGSLAEAWYDLLDELWEKNNKSVNANEFKSTIARKAKMFSGFSQHDSHEFMTFFLDYISEDLNRVSIKPYCELKEQGDNEDDTAAAKRFWQMHLDINNSIITDLFTGQFKSTIECPQCKWVSKTYDPFSTLSLPIPKLIPISMFFIPKYGMRKTIKLNFQILKNSLFGDLGNIVKTSHNLDTDFQKLRFMLVNHKQMLKMALPRDSIESCTNTDGFLFCCDTDSQLEGEVTNLPLYILYNNDLSAHPRLLSITKQMTYHNLMELQFLYIRKFINLPIDQTQYENEYKTLLEDYTKSSDNIIQICKKEYQQLFKTISDNTDKKDFINNLPYELYLKKNNQYKFILRSKNRYPKSNMETLQIEDFNQSIIDLFELINDKWEFYIDLDAESKYIKNTTSREINACKTIDSKQKKFEATLTDCLEYFQQTEQLEKNNEWYCKKCKKHLPAHKKMEIFYLPKILVIHLKRFSGTMYYSNKIEHEVDFPIYGLDMSNFIVGKVSDVMNYDLYAVSQHYGGCGGGHYTAVCKNNGQWYSYNDSSVSIENECSIVTSAAYVLFYRRKD